jgi:hypothetical protein
MLQLSPLVCAVTATLSVLASASVAAEGFPTEDALRATIRIYEGASSGTGFIVAVGDRAAPATRRHVLVTAGHALANIKAAGCTLVLRAPATQGTSVRKEMRVPIRKGNSPLWVRHPEMDVAAIFVNVPEGADLKPLEYRQLADASWAAQGKIRVGQTVYIPCFPSQLEANPAGWPILRSGSIATHPLTPLAAAKTFLVDYSQFGGDSGAPVVTCDGREPMVVGLVVAMQRQTSKTSMPFEERTVHTPLGLAIVVQSPFLRQTVDLLLKK